MVHLLLLQRPILELDTQAKVGNVDTFLFQHPLTSKQVCQGFMVNFAFAIGYTGDKD